MAEYSRAQSLSELLLMQDREWSRQWSCKRILSSIDRGFQLGIPAYMKVDHVVARS